MPLHTCRACGQPLTQIFADLGSTPLSNSFLSLPDLDRIEPSYPLCAYVCDHCFLVQVSEFESLVNIFDYYLYFSSYSTSWLKHAQAYVEMAVRRFALQPGSLVVEVASNDGYLLQYFKSHHIPILGIEPAANIAAVAEKKGIPTLVEYFGINTANRLKSEGKSADLLIGNNVCAHVPDLNDFIGGLKILLKPQGVITLEFPHLLCLIEGNQFDTIYHEHFSYLSLYSVEKVMATHGLEVFDVDKLTTHGGSLRVYIKHREDSSKAIQGNVLEFRDQESRGGLDQLDTYLRSQQKIEKVKNDLVDFLTQAKQAGKVTVGYGAPAKGNTLLNYSKITGDLLSYTVDISPHKQGLYLPGSHIPIYSPDKIWETKPDYLLILPWNLRSEVAEQMRDIRSWGGKFVVPIPSLQVF